MVLGPKLMGKPSTKIFIIISSGQNQGLAWSSDSSHGETKYKKNKNYKFWTEPRPCMVVGLKPMGKPSTKFLLLPVLDRTKALYGPRTQAYGETKYKIFYYYKFWTEPRPCMVLGLKPMGKPSTKKNKNYKCWTEPRPWMVLGLKPMGKLTARIGKALGSNIVKC